MADPVAEVLPFIFYARRYAQALGSENARSNFIVRLQLSTDTEALRAVAREFAFTAEIALPSWQRLVAISTGDLPTVLEAARAFYSHGYDEMAQGLVGQVLDADARSVAALELKAALTPDAHERRLLFERILAIEPGNRVAVDNLIMLDRPK